MELSEYSVTIVQRYWQTVVAVSNVVILILDKLVSPKNQNKQFQLKYFANFC